MRVTVKIAAGIVFLLLFDGVSAAWGASQPAPDIKTLIGALQRAEHSIVNLEIRGFEQTVQFPSADGKGWVDQPNNLRTGDAWYNGLLHSKARVNIRGVSKCENCIAPVLETLDELGFDGQFGRRVHLRSGPPGRLSDANQGQLLPNAPNELIQPFQAYTDGTGFSILYHEFIAAGRRPLSAFLSELVANNARINVTDDVIYGDPTIRVSLGEVGYSSYSIWLDMAHGCALRKIDSRFRIPGQQDWILDELTEIPELVQAAPGVWFPVRGIHEDRNGGPNHHWRLLYHAAKVVANNPNFDESVFTVPFPPGYLIDDQVHGTSFQSGDIQKTEQTIDQGVNQLKKLSDYPGPATGPGVAGSGTGPALSTSLGNAALAPGSTLPPWRWSLFASGAVAGGLAIGILSVWSFRRRARMKLPIWAMVAITVAAALAARAAENATAYPSGAVAENCGVNSAYFCLKWFGENTSIPNIAKEMKVDDLYECRCSLGDLKTLFEQHGLKASGFKADRLPEILDSVRPESVVIIRLAEMLYDADVGHFVVLAPLSNGIGLVDPPNAPVILSMEEEAKNRSLKSETGEFLVVSPGAGLPEKIGPAIKLESNVIQMGSIPIGTYDFSGKIVFHNQGTEVLRILDTQNSCSCMDIPKGDLEVQPGQTGILTEMFHREKSFGGINERAMILHTNDPRNPQVEVAFNFNLLETPRPRDINLAPRTIDFGQVASSSSCNQTTNIEISIPIGSEEELGRTTIHVQTSTPDLEVTESGKRYAEEETHPDATQPSETKVIGTGTVQFELKWKNAPKAGLFQEDVHFLISGQEVGKHDLKVPIRGEAM